MPVPSSGPLGLREDINLEVNGNVTDTNVALHQLSLDAGFSTPDAMSDFYGYANVAIPTVSTSAVTALSCNRMCINGNVTDTGNENVSRGFYFGTSANPASSNTKLTLAGTQGTGGFSCCKTSLSNGTTYYNWAFACNSAGEAQGARISAATTYPPYTPTCAQDARIYCVKDQLVTFSGRCYRHCERQQLGYVNPYNGGLVTTLNCSRIEDRTTSGYTICDYDLCNFGFARMPGVKNWACHCTCDLAYRDNADWDSNHIYGVRFCQAYNRCGPDQTLTCYACPQSFGWRTAGTYLNYDSGVVLSCPSQICKCMRIESVNCSYYCGVTLGTARSGQFSSWHTTT